MAVMDGLPCRLAVVDADVKTLNISVRLFDLPFGSIEDFVVRVCFRPTEVENLRRMALGNHQRMTAAQRRDVEEGEHLRILVDFVTGNAAGNDPAEDRIRHCLRRAGGMQPGCGPRRARP